MYIVPFGKWKGEPIHKVPEDYMIWVVEKARGVSAAAKEEFVRELALRNDARREHRKGNAFKAALILTRCGRDKQQQVYRLLRAVHRLGGRLWVEADMVRVQWNVNQLAGCYKQYLLDNLATLRMVGKITPVDSSVIAPGISVADVTAFGSPPLPTPRLDWEPLRMSMIEVAEDVQVRLAGVEHSLWTRIEKNTETAGSRRRNENKAAIKKAGESERAGRRCRRCNYLAWIGNKMLKIGMWRRVAKAVSYVAAPFNLDGEF